MDIHNNEFQPKYSEKSESVTFMVKIVVYMLFTITIIAISVFTIATLSSNKINFLIKFSTVVVVILLLFFLIRTFLQQLSENKNNKITHVVVDSNGFHHFQNLEIVKSITFDLLRPNPDKKYDIDLSDGDDVPIDLLVHYYNATLNQIECKAITFATTFSIKNGRELKVYFIQGIIRFRPDLSISPGVFDFFSFKHE
ncbi:hypothetical protein [Chitinophaga nivalis]|uniref:Transmembrane protein n=1 Tax=Chitinophaga nivalis TaxID=2991709 RepID=A0ABT3IP92_9BACT|nr:hypothetical protein [Chitinophaga nivalis]MCW3464518.1 hypothetical protein [Chitinophaga nivalis]MCW3485791.1 hypothetical protein [Chitinophaga nivalis]